MMKCTNNAGFTLIEMAIVLVVIGLVIGGVLVGKDMIQAATIRSQISQIEKYRSAVNAFRLKFNALPGDISNASATAFGLAARGTFRGQGDGNSIIEGSGCNSDLCGATFYQHAGESVMFWVDLSYANGGNVGLIDGSFSTATPNTNFNAVVTGAVGLSQLFPSAKLGNGNYIIATSLNSENYFLIEAVQKIDLFGYLYTLAGGSPLGIKVLEAYQIDTKIDDGLPQTGKVTALFLWGGLDPQLAGAWDTSATPSSNFTCYDNGNILGAAQKYSTAVKGGELINCALGFKM